MADKEARPTQELVAIDRVEDGVLFLKNGSLRQILIVSGINLDLKSEDEQQLVIGAYQNFLNSLHFSVQLFVHSRRLNIETYLEKLAGRKSEEQSELLQNQIDEYIQFIRGFVGNNPIMDKNFFIIVPFDPVKIPGAETATGKKFFGLFGATKAAGAPGEERAHAEREHIAQLAQRAEQVSAGLMQMGLRVAPLRNEEVLDLFYNLYNPEAVERKGVVKL
ncbi:MAG: hypothetical protein HYV25_03415 [Candidatus Harrisonbacteria bacterium]|nr:hypothetical protein [Candidatus Harrisonbacteria bacterium]